MKDNEMEGHYIKERDLIHSRDNFIYVFILGWWLLKKKKKSASIAIPIKLTQKGEIRKKHPNQFTNMWCWKSKWGG